MNPQPYLKNMEAYTRFDGGLNTSTSNDNLSDRELADLVNRDLSERGSNVRRTGFVKWLNTPTGASGKNQGFFRYYKADGSYEDIQAVGGKLYKGNAQLPITGLASFQTSRFIEAVQYNNSLFIATGSGLVEYDGTSAKVVTPYTPKPLEALYIGLNGLADDPTNYMTDGVGVLAINTVLAARRYGVVNENSNFTIIVTKPSADTIEYKAQYKRSSEDDTKWADVVAYGTGNKVISFNPKEAIAYDLRFYARKVGTTTPEMTFLLTNYKVNTTDQNQTVDSTTIKTCNRILLHWDRLIMYGDTTQKQAIFISDLKNPRYFPLPNSLEFKNPEQEPLNALVRFRDMIVAFAASSIQALFGKSPQDYQRFTIHTGIGCVAPLSAAVMGNYISFLSSEGLYALISVGTSESRLNVKRIDDNIKNLITKDSDAIGVTFNNQYHIVYPSQKKRFRYYHEQGVWARDESDKMDFSNMYTIGGELYAQSASNGITYVFDDSVYTDDGFIYEDIVETKSFDFGVPYNPKKLKELQLLMAYEGDNIESYCYVYADGNLILNPDTDESHAALDANHNVTWIPVSNPNMQSNVGTVFGSWIMGSSAWGNQELYLNKINISGKCLRTKVRIVNKKPLANRFLGVAYVFKLKKP
jgi:hypothetical protein